ncbi:unnamed protein product [Cyprideis torosa]|uniref:Choline/carnitine acyltransferase domain-containing protein n=1 Tax=Cyprideis torosa TaxID=163714 RepID=A0A7R8ZLW9_9CRUS|nr:unnamed protein product [Cyprideis torosa]CAG0892833.1 unnamed protein product [Cyprideis torosa]
MEQPMFDATWFLWKQERTASNRKLLGGSSGESEIASAATERAAQRSKESRACFRLKNIPHPFCRPSTLYFTTYRKAEGPCPNHVVVFHRGHIFVLNPVSRNEEIWTAHQWYKALKKVIDDTENQGQGIGILTCDFRENWASNRQKLWKRSAQNRQILKLIETSILAVILDPDEPKNSCVCFLGWPNRSPGFKWWESGFKWWESEVKWWESGFKWWESGFKWWESEVKWWESGFKWWESEVKWWESGFKWWESGVKWWESGFKWWESGVKCGEAIAFASGTQSPDRWVDKSFSMIVYKNAYQGSMSVHTPFEATVSVTFSAYIAVATAVTPPNSFPRDPTVNIGEIKELLFDLPDGILDECQRVMEASKAMLSTLSMDSFVFDAFGRDDIKKVTQIHTDSIVQIAMHLAYYRLYKKAPSTYESATVRRFYRGRTETCRSSSAEILTFAQAMVDPQESDARRYTLLCDAAHAHRRYMQRCEAGMGCDRHLLGLKMIAKEMGIDPDELPIFKDPSWKQSGGDGNYILSTSFMGYVTFVGGLVPMREDGYSFFYTMDRNAMYYSMACYATCPDTCIYRFQKEIARALTDVVELLTTRIAKL